jgi:hypothetical protein
VRVLSDGETVSVDGTHLGKIAQVFLVVDGGTLIPVCWLAAVAD